MAEAAMVEMVEATAAVGEIVADAVERLIMRIHHRKLIIVQSLAKAIDMIRNPEHHGTP
jgi:hypothetical protein